MTICKFNKNIIWTDLFSRESLSNVLNFLPCRPHLSPLATGQGVSVQHPPQHSPSNGGINPQQLEAVVVVLYFIYNPLSDRPFHWFCVQLGAVHRPSFLQLLLLVLQRTQWLLHLGVVPSPPRGVYPPDTGDVLWSCYRPLGPRDRRVRRRGGPQHKSTVEPMWVQVLRGAHIAILRGEGRAGWRDLGETAELEPIRSKETTGQSFRIQILHRGLDKIKKYSFKIKH